MKQKIGGSKIIFSGYNPEYPNFSGTYVCNVVEYSFEVIVPQNSRFLLPTLDEQIKTYMGHSGFINNAFLPKGYSSKLMWSDQYCNIHKIYTIAMEITHNILGQQVTPVLYPKEAKNPNLFYFEYYWHVK